MASGYRFPNSSNVTRSISKADATSAVGSAAIKVLGPGKGAGAGVTDNSASEIEIWTLKNPWIKSVSMGDLDYGSDDLLTMDVTLRYDWASLTLPAAEGAYNPKTDTPDSQSGSPSGIPAGTAGSERLRAGNNALIDITPPDLFGGSGG